MCNPPPSTRRCPPGALRTAAGCGYSAAMLQTLFVVAGLVAAGPSPGVAGFDAALETVLVKDGTVQGASIVSTRGTFQDAPAGVHLKAPPPQGEPFALWAAPILADGLVRARFVVDAGMRADVLFRAGAQTRPDGPTVVGGGRDVLEELDGGYGVSLDKGQVRLVRWEHRMQRFLGAEEKLSPPPKVGSTIEVVIVAAGPWLSATVYDEGFRRLAHVAVLDRGFVAGSVGLRVPRSPDTSGLTFLSVAPLKAPATTTALSPDLTMDGATTGAGVERLVGIAPADRGRLPTTLKAAVTWEKDGVVWLDTDPVGVEFLQRAGIALVAHRTQMPFLHTDPGLRKYLGKAPTKTSRGFRVDESYKDSDMVEALLRSYAERFPNLTRLEEIGRSREGRPILALLITKGGDPAVGRPAVLFDGAHHGGELISTEIVLDIVQQLVEQYGKDEDLTRFVDNAAIWCVPLINVDGNHRYIHETRDYDRKNARDIDNNGRLDGWDGVDLYRQYPVKWGGLGEVGSRSWPFHYRYRGPEAASEPEIQAMIRLAERERFAASIDYHTNATKILVPYTDPSMTNPANNEAWTIAERIAAALPVQINKKRYEVQRNLYPVDGTAQDWFRFSNGTVALLVEAPQHNPLPYDRTRNGNVVPGRGTWKEMLRATVDGPSIQVRVVDSSGVPVEASVVVVEQAPLFGERWTSRPRDGLATRLLGAPGSYTVIIEKDGQKVSRTVDVGEGVRRLDVQLP